MSVWFAGVDAVHGATPEWTALPFALVTLLGEIWVLVVALALVYWFTGRRDVAALFGVVLTALAVTLLLKLAFGMPRPTAGPAVSVDSVASVAHPLYERETTQSTNGFPSGHAVGATVTWGALAILVDRGTRRVRLALAGLAVVLVGLSRVVLGVHYPIDVVAGTLFGAAVLALAIPLFRRADDPATPALLAAVVAGGITVVVTGGASEAANATGAALGGLLAWTLIDGSPGALAPTPSNAALAVGGLGALIVGGVGLGVLVGSPIGPYLGTAVVGGGILATPLASIRR